jgi:hypothetical protein
MPIAEKIKEITTMFPLIAVPARATRPFWPILLERRVTILAIYVSSPKDSNPTHADLAENSTTKHHIGFCVIMYSKKALNPVLSWLFCNAPSHNIWYCIPSTS